LHVASTLIKEAPNACGPILSREGNTLPIRKMIKELNEKEVDTRDTF